MPQPFLDSDFSIAWQSLTPECLVPDLTEAIRRAEEALAALPQRVVTEGPSFANTLQALEEATLPLHEAWAKAGHLDSVANTPALREAYNTMLPRITDFFTRLYLRQDLWQALRAFADTAEARALQGTRRRFLEETLLDFRHSGAELDGTAKAQLEGINAELSRLTQRFSENVLDATNAWELLIEDKTRLAGLPPSALAAAAASAKAKGLGSDKTPVWRFTLHSPSLSPLLTYADDPALRRQAWLAANDVGARPPWFNTPLLWRILELRHEKARLLGSPQFADFILQRRMAKSGKQAMAFIASLHTKVKAAFDHDIQALRDFYSQATGQRPDSLQPWDIAYWSEKQRQSLYHFDEETLRPYFPLQSVIAGLFTIAERLFDIRIQEEPPPQVWHPEVRYYRINDAQGQHLGSFYTDWHPRESKRGGAWMNFLKTGGPGPNGKPHLGLICGNLTPPVNDQPALLTHREAETIFHEFGHLLHHLLGTVEIPSLNGVNVAWDFVELPSQILENWCWERESLDLFARHYQTQQPIPEDLFARLIAARHYQNGLATMRQLALARMDLELHLHFELHQGKDLDALLEKLLADYTIPFFEAPPTLIRRFTHIFGDPTGYAAAYYSYKWAEVLDADAFTRFQKEGILNPQTGRDFRDKILARGNSAPPEQLFRDFMGRDPDQEALLKRAGLLPTAKVPAPPDAPQDDSRTPAPTPAPTPATASPAPTRNNAPHTSG